MPALLVKSLDAGARVARGAVAAADGSLRIPLKDKKLMLGRTDACDVVVHSGRIAARDTVFEPTPEGWVAKNLDHNRGMVINGERVVSAVLTPGAVILLPGLTLEFVGDDAA